VAAAVAVSACQYLYLLRLSEVGGYHESTIDTLGDVVGYVTGGDFKDSMLAFGWQDLLRVRLRLLQSYVRQEYSLLLVPIALGVVRGLRARSAATRSVAVHVGWLAVGTSLYVLQYDVSDLVVFCIPLFLSLAVFLGLGTDAAIGWLEDRWAGDRRLTWGVPTALTAVVVAVTLVNWSEADQRGNVADAVRIERAIDTAGTCAVLLTDEYPDSEYFWYYLLAEEMAERDLVLANQVSPALVEEYLATGGGDVGWVAQDLRACDDPTLYTATPGQAAALAAWGLTVSEVAEDVWRVEG
jgi:hypothetical protein